MLKIRLRRVGKKKQPSYRVVVADSRAPRDGAFIETLGTYNPLTNPASIVLNDDRAREWLSKGAIPTERVTKILAVRGLVEPPKFAPKPKKAQAEEAAPAATATAEAPAEEAPAPEAAQVPETPAEDQA